MKARPERVTGSISHTLKTVLSSLVFVTLSLGSAYAWNGIDVDTGEDVEIAQGNRVREGRDIEIYVHGTADYREVRVEELRRYGSTFEIDVYDYDSREYRTLEMRD